MTLEEYFGDWIKVLDIPLLNKTINTLNQLYTKKSIMPEYKNIFKAFTLTSLNNLRVVFIGYDPYPQKDVATGLLFGNNCVPLSPSLEVIKEAAINYEIPHEPYNFDITLESWAKQGILLLNSALTVEVNKVGSHTMLWRPFIASLIHNISMYNPGIMYVLFGNQAQTFEPYINKNNTILKVQHPAYYARTKTKMPYEVFTRIKQFIKNNYGEDISFFTYLNL